MKYSCTFKMVLLAVTCLSVFAFAQSIPEIRVTTKNNQEVTTGCSGSQMMGMCMGTTTMPYVSIATFQLTDPNDSRNNIPSLTPEPTGETDSIRVRGNSTAGNNKKPYRIKFDKKQGLFRKEPAKSWVLLANFYDHTFLLNAVVLSLGQRLGLEFTNKTFQFVDVYINNSYKGVYMLTEQMQVNPGRVDIDKNNGWLVEFDYHTCESDQICFSPTPSNLSMNTRIRSPEVENNFNTNNPAVNFVVGEVNALFNAVNSIPGSATYRDLLDIESLAKYLLIQLVMDNFDFNSKVQDGAVPGSNYFYKDAGKKIKAGPLWDFDLAAGVTGTNLMSFPRHYESYQDSIRPRHVFYRKFFQDNEFVNKYRETWCAYKSEFEKMPAFMDSVANIVKGRAQANFAAYTGGAQDTRPNSESSYLGEVTKLKNWWNNRLNFYNQGYPCTGASSSSVGGASSSSGISSSSAIIASSSSTTSSSSSNNSGCASISENPGSATVSINQCFTFNCNGDIQIKAGMEGRKLTVAGGNCNKSVADVGLSWYLICPSTTGAHTFTYTSNTANMQFDLYCDDSNISPIVGKIAMGNIRAYAANNHIMLENLPSNAKVEIFNLQGKRVYSTTSYSALAASLRIEAQAKGMYIAQVTFGSERKTARVVVH